MGDSVREGTNYCIIILSSSYIVGKLVATIRSISSIFARRNKENIDEELFNPLICVKWLWICSGLMGTAPFHCAMVALCQGY